MSYFCRIKHMLFCATLAIGLGLGSSALNAFVLDSKIGEANLANSGDATELNALKNTLISLGVINANNLALDYRLNQGDTGFNVAADSVLDQWFIDVTPDTPGYFLLKFGIGGTAATADTFFFENIGELTKLVFSNSQVQYLTGGDCGANNTNACNIGRLSYYTLFDTPTPLPTLLIPEPGILLLLGLGLFGLSLIRLRK